MTSKRVYLIWLAVALALVVLPHWVIVVFAPPETGFFFSVLMMLIITPLCALAGGVTAGMNWKALWGLPLMTAGLFLAGVWLFLDMLQPDFLVYAGIYLVLGYGAMGLTAALRFSWKRLKEFTKSH